MVTIIPLVGFCMFFMPNFFEVKHLCCHTYHSSTSVIITKGLGGTIKHCKNNELESPQTAKSSVSFSSTSLSSFSSNGQLALYSPRTNFLCNCDMMPKCMYSFTYKDSSMIQHSGVHIILSWLLLLGQVLLGAI